MTARIAGVIMRHAVLFLFVFFSPFAVLPSSAQDQPAKALPEYGNVVPREVEFPGVHSLEEAQSLSRKLEGSGYRTTIRTEVDEEGKSLYRVLALPGAGEPPGGEPFPPETEPQYSSPEKPSWSLLGRKGSNLHGALTLTGIYTDNAYNTRDDKKSNFSTLLSPEIWLTVPGISQKTTPVGLAPRAAGGLTFNPPWGEVFRTYQVFLYYRPDIPLTSSNSYSPYGSSPSHLLATGLLLSGKRLTFRIHDEYQYSYQEREADMLVRPSEQDRYNANLFSTGVSYDTLNRLRLDIGYSNFMTDYRAAQSGFRDRSDNNLFSSAYYRISPKVNLLVEYQYYDISYDHDSPLDSKEHYIYTGLQWDITAKTRGYFKLGYSVKKFSQWADSYDSFSYEGQIDYYLTSKSSLSLNAYQRTYETDIQGTAFSLSNGVSLRFQHMLTPKITTGLLFAYIRDQYHGTPQDPTKGSPVESTLYQGGVDLQYAFKRWLKTRLGYLYTTKSSEDSSLEYTTNMFFFMITGSI